MRAYSADLRSRVLAAVLGGQSPPAVAERYGVSASWVRRVRQRHRDGGETGPRRRGHRRQALAADADRLRTAVARLGLTLKKNRCGRASRTART